MRLQNKSALITGAGRGIGGAIARRMAQEGADVFLVSRTDTELQQQCNWVRSHTSANAKSFVADVSNPEEVEESVSKAVTSMGKVDILVNCAGISAAGASEALAYEDWKRCLDINLNGTFFYCQAVGRHLIETGNGGKIINITSIVSHAAIPERAAYAASKGGVKQLTQNLAVEWAKHNVQVNSISPGFIITEIVEEYIKQGVHNPDKMIAKIPARRMGKVDDIAGPAVFLASSDSDYMTGTTLIVDGGFLAYGYV
ncbi:SDR family NAD(P)-dependent oxidoreductase [Alicyclobacillus sp. SO9]|uniref:SDR family NAD(P)-dependent oxidoreductase n=1 Tax=Alicyclobacillus sp. SO9 TaxID=2665646 RepID=UPI0018E81CC7|nr:glucose 1-dehydrogenase [Alicyclobacillus sp. SO9]QQE77906.1 glucose 1-dehydrogenase [Alicyclobacillus sp. SO9]